VRTRVGYCGGKKENPSYRDMGDHTETTSVDFDPTVTTYKQLLGIFWSSHHPTRTVGGRQYRYVIFYHTDAQRKLAEESRDEEQKKHSTPITTAIEPATKFTLAEDYHQKFYLRNNSQLFAFFSHLSLKDFIDSTAAAKINALIESAVKLKDVKQQIGDWKELKDPEGLKKAISKFERA